IGGYAGLTRKGNLDSLLPTELAYDDDMFYHRLLNREALYYGREGEAERQKGLAWIITESGLTMPGDRELLSKGLSLALAAVLSERGYRVQQSFLSERLTEPKAAGGEYDPGEILYYRSRGWVDLPGALPALTAGLKRLRGQSERVELLWVVNRSFGIDEGAALAEPFKALRELAVQRGWLIETG
ncbi:MAG: hypothetical protein GY797_24915, partial [Deltaproteobacteria bacterium]|nr:hypothetical protein [Deltaproteobacteria bacterium]